MKAIIVDDNPHSVQVIKTILAEHEPGIEICGTASTVAEAAELIRIFHPKLWFLDIRLKDEEVFSLFKKIDRSLASQAAIIFITAYGRKDYLEQAIKSSAFDYIYKPIDEKELIAAVERAKGHLSEKDLSERFRELEKKFARLKWAPSLEKIPVFRVNHMIDYINTETILYLESDLSTCRFYLDDGTFLTSTRNLASYRTSVLEYAGFLQISKKHIINPRHMRSFDPSRSIVLLDNGSSLEVSRRRNKDLRDYLRDLL